MHYSWIVAAAFDQVFGEQCTDPHISLFNNFFIKNEFYDTIHTFKNDFATVFSIFNFQFKQNKFYQNEPIIDCKVALACEGFAEVYRSS